jgi:hypothetical protein
MNSATQVDANRFYATTKFLYDTSRLCYEKCVVDFQTKDVSTMERECGLACLKKNMVIYKDVAGLK